MSICKCCFSIRTMGRGHHQQVTVMPRLRLGTHARGKFALLYPESHVSGDSRV
jgi:hypothetical protein